jgi:small nuclear ribonucleoprotein E
MNLVIDDAVEVQLATRDAPEKRRQLGKILDDIPLRRNLADRFLGQILLKGDNVSLIQALD